MTVSGTWRSTRNGSVYTARAILGGRKAVVRVHVGIFEGLNIGDLGKVEAERAAKAVAALRVRYLAA